MLPIIIGNWKMHKTNHEAVELASAIAQGVSTQNVEVVICPSFAALSDVHKVIGNSKVKLGAQNMFYDEEGAFTGEVSPLMLKEIGVEYVILGHSERRSYFNETDYIINKKVKKALQYGFNVVLCVGENANERQMGKTHDVIQIQVEDGLKDVPLEQMKKVVIAYEPVWAIGTSPAKPEDANVVNEYIRVLLTNLFDEEIAKFTRVIYGGSVKPDNAASFFQQPQINGALPGGASLDAESFLGIINAVR